MCILGGACLLIVFIALPETSRVIVANGTRPARGIYRSLLPGLVEPASRDKRAANDASELEHSKLKTSGLNPLDCVKLLLERDIAAVIMCHGIYYTIFCCVQASLSTLFVEVYGYGSLESGLIYLPFGIACLVSTLIWGMFSDLWCAPRISILTMTIRQSTRLRLHSYRPEIFYAYCTG